jgi:large subunit ribosomal protein L22
MEAVAKLRNYPTSPRKMRLLADLIRGKDVGQALAILETSPMHPAVPLRKLVLSAVNNWKQKNEGGDETGLKIKTIYVDGARMLKRMRPAPQGRGYRIRKRSNHVTLIVDAPEPEYIPQPVPEVTEADEQPAEATMEKPGRKTTKKKTTK